MSEKIGLLETISLAVGGMVGGGIFAVLGVVAAGAGTAAWIAFTLSGVIALCAGYSFVRLNTLCTGLRSPIGQIEEVSGERRLAGMMGWLLTFGYVGTMAMYAFAFGSYLQELVGLDHLLGFPVRPLFSVGSVVLFGGLNLLGTRASGRTEDALVATKVAILLLFAGGGLYYGVTRGTVSSGIDAISIGAITAAAIAFVAFEGWELLMFDQDSIKTPVRPFGKGSTSLSLERRCCTCSSPSSPRISFHSRCSRLIPKRRSRSLQSHSWASSDSPSLRSRQSSRPGVR